MSKPSKSQWDFGDLFPAETARKVLSVWELTSDIKRLLEKQIGQVWVSGEITNLRAQNSGHMYFTLKDVAAQLSCVLFRGTATASRQLLADGQKVLLQGEVTVYEARGQYQMIVRAVELQGVGALQAAFEKLKQKLNAEGLFAPERKRPLPAYPQRIGVVTSPTGAAIRDVMHVIQRRHPGLEIFLAPSRVQGDGAAGEIAAGIRLLNEADLGLDLILITRGGGSLEDLWAFNEEVVARAIFESALPVVSAVGPEIDFTIADFVADLRAESLDSLAGRLALRHPRRAFNESLQRLDDCLAGLLRGLKTGARSQALRLEHLNGRFLRAHPAHAVQARREALHQLERRLNALGPQQVLARGYSITMDAATGKVISDAATVKPGQKLRTRLKKGELGSRAED